MDDIGWLLWRVFGRFVGPTDEPAHGQHAKADAARTDLHAVPLQASTTAIAAE